MMDGEINRISKPDQGDERCDERKFGNAHLFVLPAFAAAFWFCGGA
jgi:hypothetical protein